jgi:hypothetical protein
MSDILSTPRKVRAASAPPLERSLHLINTFPIKTEHCELIDSLCRYEAHVNPCTIANAAPTATPKTMDTEELATAPRVASLPAIQEILEPESASPDAQLAASHPGQEALDALLEQQSTEELRRAVLVGWAHASTNGTNETLICQFPGQLSELVAANKGWKTWKIEDAQTRGLKTFWCEKAPECILDQYLRNDSRPCVSNYFGRNKKNTARIPNMITWCRKHYQRSGYRGPKNPSNNLEWPREKAGLILEQLDRNENGYFNDTEEHLTYTVSLKKSEQSRVNFHNNHQGQSPAPNPKAKSFEAPIPVLLHIFNNYVGKHKTYDECRALTLWAESQLSKDTCADLPLWEMVPEYPDFGELSGDEEDEEEEEDMDDYDDDDEPATPRKRSPKKASPRKVTPKEKSTPKNPTPKKPSTPSRSPLATRASSAKQGRVTAQGSVRKPE